MLVVAVLKRRIHENQIKSLASLLPEVFLCGGAIDREKVFCYLQLFKATALLVTDCGVLVNEDNLAGTARQGFEAENAASGEKVEAGFTRNTPLQPVEQGFSDSGRRGSDLSKFCK